jgi:chemotaxis signal transduction protein
MPVVAPPSAAPISADPSDMDASTGIRLAADAATIRDAARQRVGIADLMVVRVGAERFAVGLAAIEEVVDLPGLRPLPHMPTAMLGVFELRQALLGVYAVGVALGVSASDPIVGLVARTASTGRRVVLAVDAVDGVLPLDFAELSDAPAGAGAIVLGVWTRGPALLAVIDAEQWVAGCMADRSLEAA